MKGAFPPQPVLKIRPNTTRPGTFELKTSDGKSLGFVMNGNTGGASFVIAGMGADARSVFQQVLMWPATRALRGRLALILLDRVEGDAAAEALRDVTRLLAPVEDSLFLPALADGASTALSTVENFCRKHGLLRVETDSASL